MKLRKELIDRLHRRPGVHGAARRRLSAGHDRDRPGGLPRPRERVAGRGRRQGRRLEAARPSRSPARATSSRARRRPTTARAPVLLQPRAQPGLRPRLLRRAVAAYLALEGRYNPGLTRRDRCRSTPSRRRPPASTRTSPSPTPRSRPAASRRCAACPLARVRQLIDDNTDGRFLGVFGEPRRERARAQPRPRQGVPAR